MKKLKKLITAAAFAVLLPAIITSCSGSGGDQSNGDARLTLLENRIAVLQASGEALEKKQNEERRAMEAKIEELKALIESASTTHDETTDTEDGVYFGFSYVLEDGNAVITAYSGDTEELIIPASILGHPVTAIADEAFKESGVRSVSIPETVKSIGWFAFADCPKLEAIHIPVSVEEISMGAFDNCESLGYIFYGGTAGQWKELCTEPIESQPMIIPAEGEPFRSE